MGINKFHDFLRKKAPHVYRQIHLSEYAGKSIAVDISGLIYKYKILNKDRWFDSFAYLVMALRRNQIHPIFIYDGEAPKEKDEEKTKRASKRQQAADKVFSLREALDKYYQTGEQSDILVSEMKVAGGPPAIGQTVVINPSALEKRYTHLESQIVHFQEDELTALNKLFDMCGVPHMVSPSEAETMCASMALNGKVDAVISNDSDVCAYGVKKFLYDTNALNETCVEIDHDQVCQALELTPDQFLDFCIMCGTDYNDNITGIGPINAYRLIRTHGSIDKLPPSINITVLNHVRTRELFRTRYPYEADIICQTPHDITQIFNFLKLKNSRIKFETLEKAFTRPEIVFED